jgi:hypothetical protein
MTQPIGEIINFTGKIKELLSEPTLDRAYSTASTILLSITLVKLFLLVINPSDTIDYWMIGFMFVVSGFLALVAYLYRKFDQSNREAELKRKTEWANTRYLLEHKHLNEMDLLITQTPDILGQIEHVKDLFENITLTLAEAIRTRAKNNGIPEEQESVSFNPGVE